MPHFAHLRPRFEPARNRQCVAVVLSIRMARVLTPRSTRKLSSGPAQEPVAFCRKPIFSASAAWLVMTAPPTTSECLDVLRSSNAHDVDAQFERPLKVWRKESVVGRWRSARSDASKPPSAAGPQIHQRVGRRFDPYGSGGARQSPFRSVSLKSRTPRCHFRLPPARSCSYTL